MRYIIIGGEISDNLRPEIFMAITHISNLLPTSSFKNQFPFEASFKHFSNL